MRKLKLLLSFADKEMEAERGEIICVHLMSRGSTLTWEPVT